MRRAALAAAALAGLAGCAHVAAPPGGPEDRTGPALVATRPGSDAVVGDWRGAVVLVFDGRVSERGIDQAVTVSPRTSRVAVDHSGDELRVRLRDGWRPGTIYHVTVLPEIRDLFGNRLAEPVRLVFSTGPAIPDTRAAGEVLDRTTGDPMPDLRVEAIRRADSLVYATVADSVGRFTFESVPEGEYLLRAYDDMNRNRALDAFEPRDTAAVEILVGEPASARLAVVLPDSTPAVIASVSVRDSVIEIGFDDFLDPEQEISIEQVSVLDPSGQALAVSRVAVGRLAEPGDTAAAAPSRRLLVELEPGVEVVPGTEYSIEVRNVRNIVGLAGDARSTLTRSAPSAPPGASVPERRSASPNPNTTEP